MLENLIIYANNHGVLSLCKIFHTAVDRLKELYRNEHLRCKVLGQEIVVLKLRIENLEARVQ